MSRDFASVLDEVTQRAEEAEAEAQAPLSFDYLAVAEELHSGRIKVAPDAVLDEYRATSALLEAELDALASALEEPLPSIDPDDIARELALVSVGSADDLARLRRTFAFGNHPDRVPARLRERAMVRMQVANQLIDEARRRLLARRGR